MKKANFIWSFLASVKLAIVLLFFMVVIFIVATLVPPQRMDSEWLWLNDLYHSKMFYVLMGLFSLNLMVCSIQRIPFAIKQYKTPSFPPPSGLYENLAPNRIIVTDKKMETVSRAVESLLKSKLFSVKETKLEKGKMLYRESGRLSLFGVYVVHLGVLMIIAGMVIGSVFGLEADLRLSEGEETNIIQLRNGEGEHPLDFSVRCDKFVVEFYDTGVPKTYRSELSFIKNGQVVRQGSVLVNHPLSFDGLRFYQASYGVSEKSRARLTYSNAGAESPEISAGQGDTFDLPVQKAKATVLRVEENMMQFGPAVKLNIETDKRNIQFWMFQHIQDIADVNPGLFSAVPLFNPGLFKPLVFSLRGIEGKYYTGLQVVRDPGVPFVLAGGLILIAGMMVIFFIAYRRIWFLLEQDPAGVRIRVAGRSHRYNEALQRRLDDLCAWMEKELAA
ncbi:MAG TPA: cytochrome c biogenesis protein ResB [Smithellaceae bacterium]|nr:MAG: Cytochrome c biogenesis protein CcsB [Deltaproteobacteria bacterium ADurb.Bin022]HNQ65921.1 cytochrome c biogenesis protein ResB [Smithella sp.]HOE32464.1 cytochrome c biogenesis protein ResB [Smithella sp.]HPL97185.1 cytochrome c biogenesis protein ResB [Smithellaceae bacterium]HPV51741.1 cytochrome c biogenesis protein ResB [Smithella sp.]